MLVLAQTGTVEKTTLFTGVDPTVHVSITGNSGNVILKTNEKAFPGEGYINTDYQKGSGFVAFDHQLQSVKAEFKKKFSFNHLGKTIRKEAPSMKMFAPWGSTLDFNLKLSDLGLGQFDFTHLNVNHFFLDVNFGEVYIDFPTLNEAIIRDEVEIHLTAGKLEITDLTNLQARNWKINGGVGELKLDIGKKLLSLMSIKLDLDIGQLSLDIPKGTRVEIRGTNRDLKPFDFIKDKEDWVVAQYHEASPLLTIDLLGPLGELQINWK